MDEPELADAFINILDTEIKTGKEPVMYRGNNTLKSLIALFSDISRDKLASRMTSMRQYDSGSCSESCEAFSCQLGFNFEDAA